MGIRYASQAAAHCKGFEDLSSAPSATPNPNGVEHTVSCSDADDVAPHELALEGRSCSRCAEVIYEKTRRLQDAPPAGGGGGNTPLHHAAGCGNLRMLFHFVTLLGLEAGHGRVAEVLRRTNERRETALHMAVSVGDKDMVKLLLWVDPRLGLIACHGTSLIYMAVSQGDENIARQLHGASGPHADLMSSYSGPCGQNALHAAVLHGEGMTQMVLGWKKDLSTIRDQNGSTPLHFAVSVQQGAYIPLWCLRHTWLRNVVPKSLQKSIENVPTWHLLDEKLPTMAYQPDNEGLLPLHVAAITDQTVAVHILLSRCPPCMGLRDGQGRTFLHAAVQYEGLGVVRYACRRPECAPVMNIQDNNGDTALHLAVVAENLRVFCDLLANRAVCLNLRNNKGQTALDLATGHVHQGFFYGRNQDKLIYSTLTRAGAKHSSYRGDKFARQQGSGAEAEQAAASELDKEESTKLTDASRTLAVGSVLIATMTFGATFARLPGGYTHSNADPAGTPALAGRWSFDAFVVASALAFILASSATVGLMYSGIAMVELPIRRKRFLVSLFLVSSSVTCLMVAFALGVYMVLAPVARGTAIAIIAISPLLLIYRNEESLQKLVAVSGPLYARLGFWVWLRWSGGAVLLRMLEKFWPFVAIFGLAGHLTK